MLGKLLRNFNDYVQSMISHHCGWSPLPFECLPFQLGTMVPDTTHRRRSQKPGYDHL